MHNHIYSFSHQQSIYTYIPVLTAEQDPDVEHVSSDPLGIVTHVNEHTFDVLGVAPAAEQ